MGGMIKTPGTFILGVVLILSCSKDTGPFTVVVRDTNNEPVMNARIYGGLDWDYYSVFTDEAGMATLPGHARNWSAIIIKDNFFPLFIEEMKPGYYTISPTPKKLELIGEISGEVVRLGQDEMISLGYSGEYRVYEYSDNGVNEIAFFQLPPCVHYFKLCGDTLWLSTHGEGFYAYVLDDPSQPRLLCHLDIPGYTIRPFAVRDTILVVAGWADPLCIYSFRYEDGSYELLSSPDSFWVADMKFIGDYVVIIGTREIMVAVFDLQDPAAPILVFSDSEEMGWTGFFYKHMVVVRNEAESTWDASIFKTVDVSNPLNPVYSGPFNSDGILVNILNDTTAVGAYARTTAILTGTITTGFHSLAIVTDGAYYSSSAACHPYYIFGSRVWKMIE